MDIKDRTLFAKGVAHLLLYRTTYGNMDVDDAFVTSDKFPLGEFAQKVREAEAGGRLSPEQKEKLNSIGFALQKTDQAWESMYYHVKEYMRKNNGVLPKNTEKTSDDILIGAWVRQQILAFGYLPDTKQQRLNAIGIYPSQRESCE